ncbi:trans-1,2-dihydrobenzene-1,2-diol dehydrogenase-like [Daktulosphaira vitifoliae]|uniref:trans-1,2-dihydrobenzene-1,2-diol dehydrogenase-like n=1 Tax=Daktulosphaira vitifoliae TaxID=58002 RepID=UPI0021AADE57|nr:trans-1,2-dihydrobenzene-1,2-diol dehydrogenase-like [Daktulosphaira vitifoliae]XP_050519796.1 trans-1,2-dihydrobenzene-1,2-diol dehydrogenase-like [Daktulosphaira vitifoliae]XP_050519797.1 trans-1,2-dihydrobenzene-1,2-diol dehydrogenase-like [Daktulosphaira vitifoliae]XP_050519798.1 trans-1,2-dihydrobenzene-1,2-diol dehydrogenase-like [Daktulosphaira vitifoliae]
MATKWGILSASKISNDFVLALNTLPVEDHKVLAVAAKDKQRAKAFAEKHEILVHYDSYELLAKDPGVEIVYIGALNHQHYSLTKLMLEHGKHVLCEKPFCINIKQLKELIEISKQKNLFLMEAMWSYFTPAYERVFDEIQKGTIGNVLNVRANFGVPINGVERIMKKEVGGGSILDLGVYPLHLVNMIYGPEKPISIFSEGILNQYGIDEAVIAILRYSNGKLATISTDTRMIQDNSAYIYGDKGYIKIHHFFHTSTKVTINGVDHIFELPKTKEPTIYENSVQLRYEAEHARQCLKKGLIESPFLDLNSSCVVQELMDTIRVQIGVHFDEDTI